MIQKAGDANDGSFRFWLIPWQVVREVNGRKIPGFGVGEEDMTPLEENDTGKSADEPLLDSHDCWDVRRIKITK